MLAALYRPTGDSRWWLLLNVRVDIQTAINGDWATSSCAKMGSTGIASHPDHDVALGHSIVGGRFLGFYEVDGLGC